MIGFVQNLLNGLLIGGVYALIGAGLTLIFGVMRVLNFAHGDFMVLGMYVALVLFGFGWDPFLSLLVALPLGFALGWLTERFILSRLVDASPDSGFLATLGLALIIQNGLQLLFGAEPRSLFVDYATATLNFGEVTLSVLQLLSSLVIGVVFLGLYLFLSFTDLGRAVRATAQNRAGAELVGIDTFSVRRLVFGFGTALAFAAGVVLIPQLFATPANTGPVFTLKAFVVTVLGGLGSVWGAVAGGLLLGVTEVLGASYISNNYRDAYGLVAFLLVLRLRPQGVLGRGGP